MRMMLSCAAILLASPALSRAEERPPQILPGAKVHVYAPKEVLGYTPQGDARRSIFATVEAITSEQLTIREGDTSRTVPLHSISRLNVVNGKRRNVLGGAVVGLLVTGVALPLVVITTLKPECFGDCGGISALIGVIAAGTAVGGGIGALVKTDRWERMPMPLVSAHGHGTVRLSIRGVHRGAAVGVTLAF